MSRVTAKTAVGQEDIPIKTAATLVTALLAAIESRVIWIETDEGFLPIADALERGAVWLEDDSGERIPSDRVEVWGGGL